MKKVASEAQNDLRNMLSWQVDILQWDSTLEDSCQRQINKSEDKRWPTILNIMAWGERFEQIKENVSFNLWWFCAIAQLKCWWAVWQSLRHIQIFTTVAQIVKLRGRVLEFQLSVIENDLPVSMYAICRANYLGRKCQGKVWQAWREDRQGKIKQDSLESGSAPFCPRIPWYPPRSVEPLHFTWAQDPGFQDSSLYSALLSPSNF